MSAERLQKFLARAGIASRRHAEELIEAGRVTVNGAAAGLGDKVDPERDAVKVDGKRVQPHRVGVYLALYKPRAVMSTVADPGGRPTVIDLIPPALRKALVPVGRLDFLTEGLILLTDDGDFAQAVAHPRYGCRKTYEVKVQGTPRERDVERLREGIPIEGRRTAPAEIEPRRVAPVRGKRRPERGDDEESENSWWTVVLGEGRTRQIREMFLRIGHPVMKLRRVAVGPVTSQGLAPGQIRALSEREVAALRRAADAAQAALAAGKTLSPRRPSGGRRRVGEEELGGRAKSAGLRSAATGRAASEVSEGGEEELGRGKALGGLRRTPARRPAAGRRGSGEPEAGAAQAPEGRRRAPQGRPAGVRPRPARAADPGRSGARRPAGGRSGAPASRPRPPGREAVRPDFDDLSFGPSGKPPARRPPGRGAGSRPPGRARAGGPPAGGRPGSGRSPRGPRSASSPSSSFSPGPRKTGRRGPATGSPRGKSPSSPRSSSPSPRSPGRRGPGGPSRPPGRTRPDGGGRPSGGGRPGSRGGGPRRSGR